MTEGELFSEVCRLDLLVKALEYKLADAEACNARLVDQVEQLTAERAEWRKDAERLAKTFVIEVYPHEWVCRSGCHYMGKSPATINHAPDCPITLHRALVEKYKKEVVR